MSPLKRSYCLRAALFCFVLVLFGLCLVYIYGCATPHPTFYQEARFQTHPEQREWLHFTTKNTVVYYQNEADLKQLNKRLSRGRFLGLFHSQEDGLIIEKVGRKIDYIFKRAQDLLNMHNCKNKINIMVYSYQYQIERVYVELSLKYKFSSAYDNLSAYYFHKLKTVYISLDTVNKQIIAHELTHSIIDHYFIIRPPVEVAEVLAQYVETRIM